MVSFTIRNARRDDAASLAALQHRSLQVCPDMDPLPAGFFLNPGLEEGRNLFCAVDGADRPIAYGMVFNNDGDRRYSDIKVDPAAGLEGADDRALRDALLARVMERAREMKAAAELDSLLLYGCYFEEGEQSLAYLKSSGFQLLEQEYVLELTIDLGESTPPDTPAPQDLTIREWPLATAEERARYLAAHNQGLPVSPLTEERLAFLSGLDSFINLTAFDGDAVAGSAIALPKPGVGVVLEYLFVLPQWRRRGIAQHLVSRVLQLLKEQGATAVQVETYLDNHAAIAVYEAAGFRRIRREVMLGVHL